MKYFKLPLLCLLVMSLFTDCSKSEDPPVIAPPARTLADLQNDFSQIDFTTGVNDAFLINIDNIFWNFRVIMPDVDFTNNNRPLIVTLHGFSGGASNAHMNTSCYAEPGFAALDAIILSPNGGLDQWFHPYNQEQVLTLIDLMLDYLPVDPNRIVVNGYSDGGNGSWWYGETHSNTFSASIPMASAYGSYNTDGTARIIPTPTYVIHGENDALFPVQNTIDWVNDTTASGSDVTLVVAPGLTHTQPCSYVTYLQDASNWLLTSVW